MYFDKIGIQGKIVQFSALEEIMQSVNIVRGGQWDWDRATYDHKFENRDTGDIYYLRVQGTALKGEIEVPDAEVQLMTPILGHHYYPHGIEYDEEMPNVLVRKCEEKLSQLKELLDEVELIQTEAVSTEDIIQRLLDIEAVRNIGELHMWDNESGHPVLSCHLIIDGEDADPVVNEASKLLREEFNIEHTTIQIDRETAAAGQKES